MWLRPNRAATGHAISWTFMQAVDRLIVAADLSSRGEILRLIDELRGAAGAFKIGLQAFIANGPSLVRELAGSGGRIFLDLKIHDIPNTAQHAVEEAAALGVSMVTVHAAGGPAMLAAAARKEVLVLAVTVLTSLDEPQFEAIGWRGSPAENVARLAALAQRSGCGGVVASPHEIAVVRETCGTGFTIVTPGIRGSGDAAGDQRRTMTPFDAVRAGADYLVVGRPITGASDRRSAALRMVEQIEAASR